MCFHDKQQNQICNKTCILPTYFRPGEICKTKNIASEGVSGQKLICALLRGRGAFVLSVMEPKFDSNFQTKSNFHLPRVHRARSASAAIANFCPPPIALFRYPWCFGLKNFTHPQPWRKYFPYLHGWMSSKCIQENNKSQSYSSFPMW